VSNNGVVSLSWVETRAPRGFVLKVAVAEGHRWSRPRPAVILDALDPPPGEAPAVRAGPCGMYLASWLEAPELRTAISIDNAWTWTEPGRLPGGAESGTPGGLSTFDSFDGIGVVWVRGAGTRATLHAAVLAGDGAALSPAVVDSNACACCGTAAVRDGRGALVAYHRHGAHEAPLARPLVLRRQAGSEWAPPVVVDAGDGASAPCPGAGPALARRGDTLVVVWHGGRDPGALQLAWSFDGGAHLGPPIPVAATALGGTPVVAMTAAGAIVGWSGEDGLLARRVSHGGVLGPIATIASPKAGSHATTWAAVGDRLLVAWESSNAVGGRIALARVGDGG
jgi:hypothetical protein